ncbi:MAG: HupE / UreJ protein [Flavobacteriaceae bacterium TMED68]|nr:MAG: HupE / UreJ protein [Flavobacteriaceae bacterium TMED68]
MHPFQFYLKLGFNHIANFNGYDHILFLVVLCAVYQLKQWKKIIILVTAFTIGHSITLFLVSFDIFSIPSRYVKLLIPITIMFTSLYNIRSIEKIKNSNMSKNYFLALFFGLIHGMDFSNYFKALIISPEEIIIPLLAFNIGLEIGQFLIVFVIVLISYVFLSVLKIKYYSWNLFVSGAAFGISLISILELSLGL